MASYTGYLTGSLSQMALGEISSCLQSETNPRVSWNYKDDVMYFTDTPTATVWAFDYDAKTGNITNRRPFYKHEVTGLPDGHIMDEEGCIWHALYQGSKVIRISTEGKVIGEVTVPTRSPTCCAFRGTVLYITSAKESDPEAYPESAKYAGAVFRADVGVRGKAKFEARLSQRFPSS